MSLYKTAIQNMHLMSVYSEYNFFSIGNFFHEKHAKDQNCWLNFFYLHIDPFKSLIDVQLYFCHI